MGGRCYIERKAFPVESYLDPCFRRDKPGFPLEFTLAKAGAGVTVVGRMGLGI